MAPGILAESVDGIQQSFPGEQALTILLAVQIDQKRGELLEEVQLDGLVVDVGPGPSSGCDAPAQDDGVAFIEWAESGPGRFGRLEFRVHDALLLAHPGSFGSVSQHQPQCAEQDGFSAARLTCEHGPSPFHIPFDVVDECVVPDDEAAQHQPKPWS